MRNVLFVMRWPEEKGHMGDRVRSSYEETAKILIENDVKCFISYPGNVSEKRPNEILNPISLDCFNLTKISNLKLIFNNLKENNIGTVFYIDPKRQWLSIAYFKLLGIKTVYYCRYGYPVDFKPVVYKQIWKWFYHRLNIWTRYIAISDHIYECLIKRENIKPSKAIVVRNGLNPNDFTKDDTLIRPDEFKNLPEDSIIIISVAQIRPEKRIDNFIKIADAALKKMKSKNIYFYHIGSGPLLEYYRIQVKELGIQNHVRLVGKKLNVKNFMQHADILLHTSEKEGICNVIGEAMLMELPVVAADIGGNNEQIINNVTGYLNPVKNIESFVNNIYELSMCRNKRENMGYSGRQHICQKFTVKNQVKGLISCIYTMS